MSGTPATPSMVYLGNLLKTMRKAKHMSLRAVAERVGTSQGYLWEIEHGQCKPSFVLVAKLTQLFSLDLNSIATLVVELEQLEDEAQRVG